MQIKLLNLVLGAAFIFTSISPVAAEPCKFSDIVSNYKKGLNYFAAKNYNRAVVRWLPLAEAGLGPAQREIAAMYAAGLGLDKSAKKAAFWSELSFRSGDHAGRRLSGKLRSKLSPTERSLLGAELRNWKARPFICEKGRFKNATNPTKLNFDVVKNKHISPENARLIDEKLPLILKTAIGQNAANRIYLSAIDRFDFYNGSRYDRYVGWKPAQRQKDKSLNVAWLSVSNFSDLAPDHFAKSIVLTAKRRVYDQLPQSRFADPLMRVIAGKRVYGSVYPDIRNGNYFKVMRQAFAMVERLPKSLQRYIDIVDEIHYNPASKHYIRSGTIDSKGAFYIKSLSSEGHRMMFVRRKVLFSSPLFFLQTFIHEGTHAVQDQKAFNDYREAQKSKAVLGRLESNGGSAGEIKSLRQKISTKMDYANRWYRGIKTKTGRIQDIAFECEATRNEIKAVKFVGGSPDIMRGSGYLKLCPEAQRQVIQWRDQLIRQNRQKQRKRR